jgi:hypothetical protein
LSPPRGVTPKSLNSLITALLARFLHSLEVS